MEKLFFQVLIISSLFLACNDKGENPTVTKREREAMRKRKKSDGFYESGKGANGW
jgi:hypothetical protein